jgi:hypothetical protein
MSGAYRATIGALLLVLAGPGPGERADGNETPDLPGELAAIADRNWETAQRLRSCVATLEEIFTQEWPEGVLSYKTTRRIWVKGRRAREEQSSAPGRLGAMRVEFPTEGGAVLGVGAPIDGARTVMSPEARIGYAPPNGLVNIIAGAPRLPFGPWATLLHKQLWCGGLPLRTTLGSCVRHGVAVSVGEAAADGIPCILLSWTGGQGGGKLWIDPARGHMVCRREVTYKTGELMTLCTARIREYADGVFWFERSEEKNWKKDGTLYRHRILVVKELLPNAPLDDALFTMKALDVPPGTPVHDRVNDTVWRYGE